MPTVQQIVVQEMIEHRFNRKLIDARIKQEIESSDELMVKVSEGAVLLQNYLTATYTYQSKTERLAALKGLELGALVMELYIGTAYFTKPELFSSAAAQLAGRIQFSDKVDAITTVAEMLAILADTDVFDVFKLGRSSSLMLVSRIGYSDELTQLMENCRFLPPMVCEPLELKHNYSSGYLTHDDGLVLGTGNMHSGDLCLDVLNTMNSVALTLNTDFISTVEEEPTFDLMEPTGIQEQQQVQVQKENWETFKRQSYEIYSMLAKTGNKFYLTHKYDMRGRIYSQGYHVNTEGVGHKKVMVELHNKQVITGVPAEFQL